MTTTSAASWRSALIAQFTPPGQPSDRRADGQRRPDAGVHDGTADAARDRDGRRGVRGTAV